VSAGLVCQLFYDPARQPGLAPGPAPAPAFQPSASQPSASESPASQSPSPCEAVAIDAAPDAAGRLERLGLTLPDDLPAALVAGSDGRLRLVGVRLTGGEAARVAAGEAWRPTQVVMYGTAWCSDCRLARRVLDEAGVAYTEIDVERDASAAAVVRQRSGGRQVSPTLLLDGRLWAFNPEPALLRRLVAAGSGG